MPGTARTSTRKPAPCSSRVAWGALCSSSESPTSSTRGPRGPSATAMATAPPTVPATMTAVTPAATRDLMAPISYPHPASRHRIQMAPDAVERWSESVRSAGGRFARFHDGHREYMVSTQSPTRSVPTRPMEFDACFDDLPKHFAAGGDIVMSHVLTVLSSLFPDGEEYFVRSVEAVRDRIDEPRLRGDV